MRLVAGLDTPTAGTITVDGQPVKGPQTQVGMVFQNPILLEWRTALGNVMIQGEAHGIPKPERHRRATELLTSVGLGDFLDKYPSELSGGMQQRVSICRALLHDPGLILMDEPFGALDAMTRDQMNVDLQRLWMGGGKSVMFITHSIGEAVYLSDAVVVMTGRPGRIREIVTIDLARPRQAAVRDTEAFVEYTRHLRQLLNEEDAIQQGGPP
jgi:NitT/TauT family transport system ATP-binding protein